MIWTHFLNKFWLMNLTWLQSIFWDNYSSCTSECKSIIPSFHTIFWDKGVENNDSEIILEIWKSDGLKLLIKITHIYIILVGCILEVSGGFLRTPGKNDWAAFVDQSDRHRNHHLEVIFPSLSICFMHTYITMHWGQCMR